MSGDRPQALPQETSGNPFETPELIELRWTQRRQVQCMPAAFLSGIPKIKIPKFRNNQKRQLVELYVRQLAKAEAANAGEYLTQCEVEESTNLLFEALSVTDTRSDRNLRGLAQELESARQAAVLADPSEDTNSALVRFGFLAFVADALSDDSYRTDAEARLGIG